MNRRFKKLIELGHALKEKSQTGRAFHLSAIYNKSRLISLGINDYNKSHPQTLNYNYHKNAKMHSEMRATLKLGLTDCEGLTIVNLRIDNNDKIANAKPCRGCESLIRSLNFKKVFCSNNEGEFEELTYV